ncbi:hypothetical protein B0A53_02589 [Rhodotorula sp. CCFEE 5036]|nr:hypothetical protein B0A53_02589 [Rhodotorula sp. CCFEE 5036]
MSENDHEQTFESASAGASLTFPMQCSALRKNGHVVIKGRPCKIIDMSTSKTGKHGHAKVHLVATDIFTGKKLEDLSPSTHNMDVPNVVRNEYTLMNIDDGFLNLLTADGGEKNDVKVPDNEIGQEIQKAFDDGVDIAVTVTSAMGEEHCLAWKPAPHPPLQLVVPPRTRTFLSAPDPAPTPFHTSAIAPLVSINCRSHSPFHPSFSRASTARPAGRQAPLRHERIRAKNLQREPRTQDWTERLLGLSQGGYLHGTHSVSHAPPADSRLKQSQPSISSSHFGPSRSGPAACAIEPARAVALLRRLFNFATFSSAAQMSEPPSDHSVSSALNLLCDKVQAELALSVQSKPNQTPVRVHPLLNMINCLDNASSSECEIFLPDLDLATNPLQHAAIDEPATNPPRTGLIIEMHSRCLGTLYDPAGITVRQVLNMTLAYWSDNLECATAEEADALREAHSIPVDFPLPTSPYVAMIA